MTASNRSVLIAIDPEADQPVYRQIIDSLRRAAAEGRLAPGTALPSIRQLAADLGINPNTASKAYLLLEQEGLIHGRRRRGYFLAEEAAARASAGEKTRLQEAVRRLVREGRDLGLSQSDLLQALATELDGTKDDTMNGRS